MAQSKLDRRLCRIRIFNIAPVTMGVYIIHPIIIMFALKIVSVETVLTSFAFFGIVLVVAFFIAKIIYKIPKVKKLIEL